MPEAIDWLEEMLKNPDYPGAHLFNPWYWPYHLEKFPYLYIPPSFLDVPVYPAIYELMNVPSYVPRFPGEKLIKYYYFPKMASVVDFLENMG